MTTNNKYRASTSSRPWLQYAAASVGQLVSINISIDNLTTGEPRSSTTHNSGVNPAEQTNSTTQKRDVNQGDQWTPSTGESTEAKRSDQPSECDFDDRVLEHDNNLIPSDISQLKNQIFSTTTSMTEDSVETKQSDKLLECDIPGENDDDFQPGEDDMVHEDEDDDDDVDHIDLEHESSLISIDPSKYQRP
ncbi:hypothetical protein LINGRAHAP2_LOCUS20101 [Linum grandiflorum]